MRVTKEELQRELAEVKELNRQYKGFVSILMELIKECDEVHGNSYEQ